MLQQLQLIVAIACLVVGIVVIGYVAVDRRPDRPLLGLLAILEVAVLVQVVTGMVAVLSASPDISLVTYIGYLLATAIILPLATGWAIGEPSRGGTAVLLVGLVVVPFLILRLTQIWTP